MDEERWKALEKLLLDPERGILFLEAKAKNGLVFDLAKDFKLAIQHSSASTRLNRFSRLIRRPCAETSTSWIVIPNVCSRVFGTWGGGMTAPRPPHTTNGMASPCTPHHLGANPGQSSTNSLRIGGERSRLGILDSSGLGLFNLPRCHCARRFRWFFVRGISGHGTSTSMITAIKS